MLCDTETLATLPPGSGPCGRGEMAKYAFLGDGRPDARCGPADRRAGGAAASAIKAGVVGADEREGGRRMILNYGHTLAHALEAAALVDDPDWDLRHGEAVAIGLVFAALLARRLGRIDDARVAEHRRVVGGFDLPTDLPAGADADELRGVMGRDKKAHRPDVRPRRPRGVELVRGVGRRPTWSLPWPRWEPT